MSIRVVVAKILHVKGPLAIYLGKKTVGQSKIYKTWLRVP
jgi:hypothetical protein